MWRPKLKKVFKKNTKLFYYIQAALREIIPGWILRASLPKKLRAVSTFDAEYIKKRVNYYNKLGDQVTLSSNAIKLFEVTMPKKKRVYYFDTTEYTRFFDLKLKINLLFGDITHIPDEPSIVKSRPVAGDNSNSIVLKLNKVRHFTFYKDSIPFENKKNKLVGRSWVRVSQPQRIRFYENYFNHPLCDIGQTNTHGNLHWLKNTLSIHEFFEYKFILCLEGNDVASNLKWVMASNSIAVMPEPKYETWFMEGTLKPDFHYIRIKDDYSDLEEQLNYYIQHTKEAIQIARNANDYINQFRNPKREDLISLLVLEKYFYKTGQIKTDYQALFN